MTNWNCSYDPEAGDIVRLVIPQPDGSSIIYLTTRGDRERLLLEYWYKLPDSVVDR